MLPASLRGLPLVALLGLIPGSPAHSGERPGSALRLLDLERLEAGLPCGWQLDTKEGKVAVLACGAESSGQGSWVHVAGEGRDLALELRCEKASFSLNRDMSTLDQDGRWWLEWEWLANELPLEGDMRVDERNDQVLQVLVKLDTTRKRVISYVWDTTATEGTERSESYALGLYTVKVLCVQSGAEARGRWEIEQRDLRADYERLFGSDDFPGVAGIRIQSNSQQTQSVGAGSVRNLVLRGRGPAGPQ